MTRGREGSVPDAAFGNYPGSGYNTLVVSQITQAAMSALFPYVSSVKALFNGIDEFWARGVLKKDWSPYNWDSTRKPAKPR